MSEAVLPEICCGCFFYETIDEDGNKACTFHWEDDEAIDWEIARNCTDISY